MGKLIRNGIEFSGSAESASRIKYNNTNSGLSAVTTQAAIDEIATTTINGKTLTEDRVLYAQDIPSKNLLAPIYASNKTAYGITYTLSDDGTITANGTATSQTIFPIGTVQDLGEVILSGCPVGGDELTYSLTAVPEDQTILASYDCGEGVTFNNTGTYTIAILIRNGKTVNNVAFKPMVRLASVSDSTYVPYAMTNVELYNRIRTKRFLEFTTTSGAKSFLRSDLGMGPYDVVLV